MKRILAGVVVVMMLTGGAVQEPFQEAFLAWSKGDYASAFRLWRPLAAQGDAASQFYLATLYEQGRGVPQDYAEAVGWYRLAAERGYGRAQSRLGWLYANGFGVPVDFVQAHKWLDLATVAHYPNWDKPGGKEAAEIRDRIASVMTAMQIAEARKLAREWKPK